MQYHSYWSSLKGCILKLHGGINNFNKRLFMHAILLVPKYHFKRPLDTVVILKWSQTCRFTQLYEFFTQIHIKLHKFKRSKLMKPDIVGGLEYTFCNCWKYYYIRVSPNLGQGFMSLCVSFSGKSGHIYPCQTFYIRVWPT